MNATDDIGQHRPDRWRGLLVFDHLPDDLQRAEDQTQEADLRRASERAETDAVGRTMFARPATAAERILLQHLGFEVPADLKTVVRHATPGVRNRTWPALRKETP